MSWSDGSEDNCDVNLERAKSKDHTLVSSKVQSQSCPNPIITCPSCGHKIHQQDDQVVISNDLPSLPAGVKFDPSDREILMHLEAKVSSDIRKLHPLIDEFIPTLEGENGICYTHPEKLPGVSKDGQVRHFFHRPSKAYTTGTRKRRKVSTDEHGHETRWHKTGKTRPVSSSQGALKGFKKILVLYTNYGRQRKPEKTNWVMHQYHLGHSEDEKDGELVLSKVFYQTQPRQCGSGDAKMKNFAVIDRYNYTDLQGFGFEHGRDEQNNREMSHAQMINDLMVREGDGSCSFLRFTSDASKGKESFMKNQ